MSKRPGTYLGGGSVVAGPAAARGTAWSTFDDAGVDTTERKAPVPIQKPDLKKRADIFIGKVAIAQKKRLQPPIPPKWLEKEIAAAGGIMPWIEADESRKRTLKQCLKMATKS